jgi:predicted anti-sigma-YlaC factor YlaD
MSTNEELDEMLAVDPVDSGCAAGFEVLHQYVEVESCGGDPARTQPGLAAHLRNCPACREDYQGLRDAVDQFGDARPPAF